MDTTRTVASSVVEPASRWIIESRLGRHHAGGHGGLRRRTISASGPGAVPKMADVLAPGLHQLFVLGDTQLATVHDTCPLRPRPADKATQCCP